VFLLKVMIIFLQKNHQKHGARNGVRIR